MLVSTDVKDQIEITKIRLTGLPKSRTRLPNVLVKVVVYTTKGQGGIRTLEVSTDVSKNTQNPTWDKIIPIECPRHPRMIDFEVCDRALGRDREITRYRLMFSFIPGVELNFAGRSLMYGLDGESGTIYNRSRYLRNGRGIFISFENCRWERQGGGTA